MRCIDADARGDYEIFSADISFVADAIVVMPIFYIDYG